LGFDDGATPRAIANETGFDFIVSENAFLQNEDPARAFAELMFVDVSSDGVHFARMPSRSRTPLPVGAFGVIDPANTKAFAGVRPVMANVDENDIDPFDPAAAGGDAFDLAWVEADPLVIGGAVDIDAIRYVRLVDVIGNGATLDSSGKPIYDPTGTGIGGADVDALDCAARRGGRNRRTLVARTFVDGGRAFRRGRRCVDPEEAELRRHPEVLRGISGAGGPLDPEILRSTSG
jgi:hypothetical protein